MLGQIGQAMLTDFAAMTGIAAMLILAGLLSRKRRLTAPRFLVWLRRVVLAGAASVCVLAPRFSDLTLANGILLAVFILAAELAAS